MTLTVKITVPAENGPFEALVRLGGQTGQGEILEPGDSVDVTLHKSQGIYITELPAGSKRQGMTLPP